MAGRYARGAHGPPARSQHFLRTGALAADLVRDACVGPDDVVVDIGAGTGRLTEHLAREAARVVAVEVDPAMARRLRGRWTNVDVVEGDAAAMALPREPFRVVSNLPFHRTADLLHLLLDDPRVPLLRADLVVAWDVAVKRALPWPSSVNGVVWSAFYEASVARRLSRSAFSPAPAVDAGVLVFRRRGEPLVGADSAAEFRNFVARGFRRGLGSVAPRRSVDTVVRGTGMARDLDAHAWAALFGVATRGARPSALAAPGLRSAPRARR